MQNSVKARAGSALKAAVAFVPWLLSMYVLFWLESGEIWTSETAHRGKLSVMVLMLGMGLSFLIHSGIAKYHQNQKVASKAN